MPFDLAQAKAAVTSTPAQGGFNFAQAKAAVTPSALPKSTAPETEPEYEDATWGEKAKYVGRRALKGLDATSELLFDVAEIASDIAPGPVLFRSLFMEDKGFRDPRKAKAGDVWRAQQREAAQDVLEPRLDTEGMPVTEALGDVSEFAAASVAPGGPVRPMLMGALGAGVGAATFGALDMPEEWGALAGGVGIPLATGLLSKTKALLHPTRKTADDKIMDLVKSAADDSDTAMANVKAAMDDGVHTNLGLMSQDKGVQALLVGIENKDPAMYNRITQQMQGLLDEAAANALKTRGLGDSSKVAQATAKHVRQVDKEVDRLVSQGKVAEAEELMGIRNDAERSVEAMVEANKPLWTTATPTEASSKLYKDVNAVRKIEDTRMTALWDDWDDIGGGVSFSANSVRADLEASVLSKLTKSERTFFDEQFGKKFDTMLSGSGPVEGAHLFPPSSATEAKLSAKEMAKATTLFRQLGDLNAVGGTTVLQNNRKVMRDLSRELKAKLHMHPSTSLAYRRAVSEYSKHIATWVDSNVGSQLFKELPNEFGSGVVSKGDAGATVADDFLTAANNNPALLKGYDDYIKAIGKSDPVVMSSPQYQAVMSRRPELAEQFTQLNQSIDQAASAERKMAFLTGEVEGEAKTARTALDASRKAQVSDAQRKFAMAEKPVAEVQKVLLSGNPKRGMDELMRVARHPAAGGAAAVESLRSASVEAAVGTLTGGKSAYADLRTGLTTSGVLSKKQLAALDKLRDTVDQVGKSRDVRGVDFAGKPAEQRVLIAMAAEIAAPSGSLAVQSVYRGKIKEHLALPRTKVERLAADVIVNPQNHKELIEQMGTAQNVGEGSAILGKYIERLTRPVRVLALDPESAQTGGVDYEQQLGEIESRMQKQSQLLKQRALEQRRL